MSTHIPTQTTITRTDRGLSVAGTRLTLYALLDYLSAEWPPKLVQDWFNLTEQQMQEILTYIAEHKEAVMDEYATVMHQAEQRRQYWDRQNRWRDEHQQATPVTPALAHARAKLQAWKAELPAQ